MKMMAGFLLAGVVYAQYTPPGGSGGGAGTVTFTGTQTPTALVTNSSNNVVQTPNANATLSVGGVLSLPGSLRSTTLLDANGSPFILSSATASAVDSITITNAASANPATVSITASGSDANINLQLAAKGTGAVQIASGVATGSSPPTCTAGTGGVWCAGEGTAPTGAAGVDMIYADSTANRHKVINNGGTATTLALFTDNLSVFAATTSAQLAGVISDEQGSGALVFATSPTLTTPALGVATATTINKVTLTAPATGSTLTIADGKTLTASNTLTLAGTDATTITFPATTGTMLGATATSTTTTQVLHASATAGYGTFSALAVADLPAADFSTGTSKTFTLSSGYFECTGTCTITMPVPSAGVQYCVRNANNVATVITFAAIGSSAMYENTAMTAYGTAGTGTLVSGGAVGDKMCLVGKDSTHYDIFSYNGTWTAN